MCVPSVIRCINNAVDHEKGRVASFPGTAVFPRLIEWCSLKGNKTMEKRDLSAEEVRLGNPFCNR